MSSQALSLRSLPPLAALCVFFAASPLAAETPPGALSRIEGFSGMVKIGKAEYLVVHDRKVKSESARLGRVTVVKEGSFYQPIEVADWKGDRANDLESVCRLPNGEFLAAESGVREEEGEGGQTSEHYGRIFRLAIEGDRAEVRAAYPGAKLLVSTKKGKGDDYEGLLCVPGAGARILVIQGERGGSKPYPHSILRWGWLDLATGQLTFSAEGLAGLEVDPKSVAPAGAEQRDIADLYADPSGAVWAAAAADGGDSGPFRSYIYKLGQLQPEKNPPIRLEAAMKPTWVIDGFKIEALGEAWTENGALAFGTEDEDIGGVIRELFKPAP